MLVGETNENLRSSGTCKFLQPPEVKGNRREDAAEIKTFSEWLATVGGICRAYTLDDGVVLSVDIDNAQQTDN